MDGIVMRVTLLPLRVTEETITLPEEEEEILTRTNFIREGLPKGGHSSTHTRDVP